MKNRVALVTGCSGQTGSYVVEELLGNGWEVHGLSRSPASGGGTGGKAGTFFPHILEDHGKLPDLLLKTAPTHVFHLAAQSSPGASFANPVETLTANTVLTLKLLEACRNLPAPPRFLHASSAEIFGSPGQLPVNEKSLLQPISPYGISKAAAHQLVQFYRRCHGLPACNAILLSHESPRRGPNFVTSKLARAAARISRGIGTEVFLGDLNARRDWGWAPDYAHGCVLALTGDIPSRDFIFATGVSHSVEEWAEACFTCVGLDWKNHVRTDPAFLRPTDIPEMRGDATLAREMLGWAPTRDFKGTVRAMVEAELAQLGEGGSP